ncbi:MAG: chloride channel protein, partial [Myxococcota bacterium]
MRLKNVLHFRRLQEFFASINPRTIYLYSVIIGLLSGLGAIVFNELLHAAVEITMESWARLPLPPLKGEGSSHAIPGPPRRWLLLVLPVAGGLISGLLVKTFAPEAEGTGTDGYIDAFHNKAGSMRRRVPWVKSLATLATI